MGRPSKLTDHQRAEAQRRLTGGESYLDVSKAMKIPKTTLVRNFSDQIPKLKNLAGALASIESEIAALPVMDQRTVRTITDQMKAIQEGTLAAATNHAQNAHRLSEMATKKLAMVDETAVMLNQESGVEDLRQVARLTALSNEAMKTPMGLMTANKDKGKDQSTLEDLVTGAAS